MEQKTYKEEHGSATRRSNGKKRRTSTTATSASDSSARYVNSAIIRSVRMLQGRTSGYLNDSVNRRHSTKSSGQTVTTDEDSRGNVHGSNGSRVQEPPNLRRSLKSTSSAISVGTSIVSAISEVSHDNARPGISTQFSEAEYVLDSELNTARQGPPTTPRPSQGPPTTPRPSQGPPTTPRASRALPTVWQSPHEITAQRKNAHVSPCMLPTPRGDMAVYADFTELSGSQTPPLLEVSPPIPARSALSPSLGTVDGEPRPSFSSEKSAEFYTTRASAMSQLNAAMATRNVSAFQAIPPDVIIHETRHSYYGVDTPPPGEDEHPFYGEHLPAKTSMLEFPEALLDKEFDQNEPDRFDSWTKQTSFSASETMSDVRASMQEGIASSPPYYHTSRTVPQPRRRSTQSLQGSSSTPRQRSHFEGGSFPPVVPVVREMVSRPPPLSPADYESKAAMNKSLAEAIYQPLRQQRKSSIASPTFIRSTDGGLVTIAGNGRAHYSASALPFRMFSQGSEEETRASHYEEQFFETEI